jgi:thiol-disulfide isomerase/thioredoxin
MKKTISFLFSCCCSLLGLAQNNTTIHADIKDLPAGQWVYWHPMMNSLQKDSVQSIAGGFTISMDIPDGDVYIFQIGPYKENSILFSYLEKGSVEIKGEGPMFKDAKLSGEKCLSDYEHYKAFITADPGLKGRAEVYKKANDLYAKKDSAGLAALQPELEKLDSTNKALTKQWIAEHKSSSVSAFLLSFELGRLSLDQKDSILKTLAASARNNAPAKRIEESVRINNLTGIGKVALDFTQNDTLGKPVSLKDFRGKYVLIDFWASWCVPCRAENPNVVAAYNKYKDKNFTVISVSLDQPNGKEKWLKAIHDDHLTWTHVSDLKWWNNAVAKEYDIQSIPANLLIDPQGKIIGKDLREGELEKKLGELLAGAQPFILKGKLAIGAASGFMKLYYTGADGQPVQDSSRVTNGAFEFHGTIARPTMAYLSGPGHVTDMSEGRSTDLFMEPGVMTISLPAGNYRNAVVTGSKTQADYAGLTKQKEAIRKEMEPLSVKYKKAGEAMLAAVRSKKSEAEIDTLRYRAAAIHDQFDPYNERMEQIDYQFFAAHPQSYITAFELRFYVNALSLDSLKLFYDRLGEVVQQSPDGKNVKEEIEKLQAGSPGSVAKDFTAIELNGNSLTLSSLKGKYVLIDFWASWCVPCRKSMPHVKELYAFYKDKGFDVIGVSDDDRDSTAWKRALAKDGTDEWHNVLRGLDWDKIRKHLPNDKDISEKFGIHSLPTKILIDKDGKIIGRYDKGTDEEAAAMDKQLAGLLGQ